MNRLAGFVVACGLALAAVSGAKGQSLFQPIAVVNDSAITGFDLDQRMRMIQVLEPATGDQNQIRREAMETLVEDRLKVQYAERFGLKTTDDDLRRGLEAFAENRNLGVDRLKEQLTSAGISQTAIDDFVRAQLLWNEIVRTRFQSRINPGEADIDNEIALLTASRGRSYRLREIGLPLTAEGRNAAETQALANRLSREITTEAAFIEAVKRYSRSPSAQRDGDLGWAEGSRLPPALLSTLSNLRPGQVTPPLPIQGGLTLIQLAEIQDSADPAAANDPNLRERIRNRLVTQQADRLAEGLLQELRRDAIIRLR